MKVAYKPVRLVLLFVPTLAEPCHSARPLNLRSADDTSIEASSNGRILNSRSPTQPSLEQLADEGNIDGVRSFLRRQSFSHADAAGTLVLAVSTRLVTSSRQFEDCNSDQGVMTLLPHTRIHGIRCPHAYLINDPWRCDGCHTLY